MVWKINPRSDPAALEACLRRLSAELNVLDQQQALRAAAILSETCDALREEIALRRGAPEVS